MGIADNYNLDDYDVDNYDVDNYDVHDHDNYCASTGRSHRDRYRASAYHGRDQLSGVPIQRCLSPVDEELSPITGLCGARSSN